MKKPQNEHRANQGRKLQSQYNQHSEKPQDKCGVFGAVSKTGFLSDLAGPYIYLGIGSLQHRGKEAAGISVFRDGEIETHKDKGLVGDVFTPHENHSPLSSLGGSAGIAHTRYSTRGKSGKANLHPIEFEFDNKPAAIAHNGNLINVQEMSDILAERGVFDIEGTSDTVLLAALVASSKQPDFESACVETLNLVKGAFSLIALYDGEIYAAKDSHSFRPLCIAENEDFYLIASETCATDKLGARFIGELEAGDLCRVGSNYAGVRKWCGVNEINTRTCVFEGHYLSHPNSRWVDTVRVSGFRETCGRILATEHPFVDEHIDVVAAVPDSGNHAAEGFFNQIRKSHPEAHFKRIIERDHNTGRTFIEAIKSRRHEFPRIKFSINPDIVYGKNIVLVDDSVVRSHTMSFLIPECRRFGANKVFVCSASPPIKYSCHFGVDTPDNDELIAHNKNIQQICEEIYADDLRYLSIEGQRTALKYCGFNSQSVCEACMTGEYPIPIS